MDLFFTYAGKLKDAGILNMLTVVISAVISYRVARVAAKSEIKRLRESWAREDKLKSQVAFDEMVTAVSHFIAHDSPASFEDAVAKVAVCRSSVTGEMAAAVDEISRQLARHLSDTTALTAALDSAIEQRRISDGGKRARKVDRNGR